ncbi:MAG: metallophosphoesterase, partial [Candidatus Nanohalobium sp.]
MEILGFQTIDSKPALYHPALDLVVISDIHLGLEGSMTSKGSYVPRFQLDDIKDELEEIREETGADRILVNGDLKNQFSTSYTEKQEVDEFLEFLIDLFDEVLLIEGNHDTFLDNTAEKHGLELRESFGEDGVLFVHGHEDVDENFDTLVIGHEHPALALTDDVGVKEKIDCFLYGEIEAGNIVVMPAYSKISNGSEVNNMPREELLCPVLREYGVDDLKAVGVSREAGLFEFPELSKIK